MNINYFDLTLSVSHKKIASKKEGQKVVNFHIKQQIDLDKNTLQSILTSNLQSTNI